MTPRQKQHNHFPPMKLTGDLIKAHMVTNNLKKQIKIEFLASKYELLHINQKERKEKPTRLTLKKINPSSNCTIEKRKKKITLQRRSIHSSGVG